MDSLDSFTWRKYIFWCYFVFQWRVQRRLWRNAKRDWELCKPSRFSCRLVFVDRLTSIPIVTPSAITSLITPAWLLPKKVTTTQSNSIFFICYQNLVPEQDKKKTIDHYSIMIDRAYQVQSVTRLNQVCHLSFSQWFNQATKQIMVSWYVFDIKLQPLDEIGERFVLFSTFIETCFHSFENVEYRVYFSALFGLCSHHYPSSEHNGIFNRTVFRLLAYIFKQTAWLFWCAIYVVLFLVFFLHFFPA